MLKRCKVCDHDIHPERESDYCVACVEADWRLIDKAKVTVHTSHKQGPMVSRPDMYDGVTAYDRG